MISNFIAMIRVILYYMSGYRNDKSNIILYYPVIAMINKFIAMVSNIILHTLTHISADVRLLRAFVLTIRKD